MLNSVVCPKILNILFALRFIMPLLSASFQFFWVGVSNSNAAPLTNIQSNNFTPQ